MWSFDNDCNLPGHRASKEIDFEETVQGIFFQGLEAKVDKLLMSEKHPYAPGEAQRVWRKLSARILWSQVRQCFPNSSEEVAYVQAVLATRGSPCCVLLRLSALRYAKKNGNAALLKAIDRMKAEEPAPASGLSYAEDRLPCLDEPYQDGLPYSDDVYRPCILRWRLACVLDHVAKEGGRTVSTWDVLAQMLPSANRRRPYDWMVNALCVFSDEAEKRGIAIRKVPAPFAALVGEEACGALLDPAVKERFFSGTEDLKEISEFFPYLPPMRSWIGCVAEDLLCSCPSQCIRISHLAVPASPRHDRYYGEWDAEVNRKLFDLLEATHADLAPLAKDPAYARFLKSQTCTGRLYNWNFFKNGCHGWLPNEWAKSWEYTPYRLYELILVKGLFAPVIPEGFGESADQFVQGILKRKLLHQAPEGFLKALYKQCSLENQKKLLFACPDSWTDIALYRDPVFEAGGWRLICRTHNQHMISEARKSLAREKSASAYLRFAIQCLSPRSRRLDWLKDEDLEQRFIGDFHGTELWQKAGGQSLESNPDETICRAWGSESYRGTVRDIARAVEIGLKDASKLRFMLTRTGLERGREKLLKALLRAGRPVDESLVNPQKAIKTFRRAFRDSRDHVEKRRLAGQILRLLPEADALRQMEEFLVRDVEWAGSPLRSIRELPLLFGEFRRDPVGLQAALSKVSFPENEVKVALRRFSKRLEELRAPFMVQASFGLFAALWPDKNAELVKWLVSAINWKRERGDRLGRAYRSFEIPKRHGGKRLISAPRVSLKRLQHAVLCRLLDPLESHPAAMGFVAGRSILKNAKVHEGQPVVAVADVHNCFPSVKWPVLYRVLERDLGDQIGLPAVALVAELCTHRGGLPMGSPASPALLNRVLYKADEILSAEAEKRGCRYTRYADDITFSGGEAAVELLGRAKSVLALAGLELDPEKTNIFRRGRRQMVTGLVVNEKAGVPRRYRRLVRAAVNKYCKGGDPQWDGRAMTREELLGRVAFIRSAHPEEGEELQEKMRDEDERRSAEASVVFYMEAGR